MFSFIICHQRRKREWELLFRYSRAFNGWLHFCTASQAASRVVAHSLWCLPYYIEETARKAGSSQGRGGKKTRGDLLWYTMLKRGRWCYLPIFRCDNYLRRRVQSLAAKHFLFMDQFPRFALLRQKFGLRIFIACTRRYGHGCCFHIVCLCKQEMRVASWGCGLRP